MPLAAPADTALILANPRYDNGPQLRGLRTLTGLEDVLSRAGFDVIEVRNGTAADLRGAVARLLAADERERVLIVAGGHFLRGASDSWLLGTDARRPDLATVSGAGVPVSVLTGIAASASGRAVVALATEDAAFRAGPGLSPGIGRVEAPQGVTVVAGPPEAIASFVSGPLLRPGATLPDALAAAPDLSATGFLSPGVAFVPGPPSGALTVRDEDAALWAAVEEIDTPDAYRTYLARFPEGIYADLARSRIAPTQVRGPEAIEADLRLARDERRQLQRYLTMLGHDTRGADGIFGPATRAAIADWQEDRGLRATGFLDGAQVAALRRDGEIREAVLAEQRREEERADRAWWEATGAGRTPEGARDYLDRYPEGLFAEEARRVQGETAWRRGQEVDTIPGYRRFIADFPDSRHVPTARARIVALQDGPAGGGEGEGPGAAQEAALNLPSVTRLLVEQRLARLGLDPGRVDGAFDARTRRAIRDYQDDRGIPATGYLDQSMLALLLAGSLGDILR
jgi:peptidoglycan hydrolase-like protein with peptidoglycan-binding domain